MNVQINGDGNYVAGRDIEIQNTLAVLFGGHERHDVCPSCGTSDDERMRRSEGYVLYAVSVLCVAWMVLEVMERGQAWSPILTALTAAGVGLLAPLTAIVIHRVWWWRRARRGGGNAGASGRAA